MNNVLELTPNLALRIIDPNELPGFWENLLPLFEEACSWSGGESTPESVVKEMFDGNFQLWAFMHGDKPVSILVICISRFGSGKRKLEIVLASGSGLKDWLKFEHHMIAFARSMGCSELRMIGREGLQRMLPDWKRTAIVLERSV